MIIFAGFHRARCDCIEHNHVLVRITLNATSPFVAYQEMIAGANADAEAKRLAKRNVRKLKAAKNSLTRRSKSKTPRKPRKPGRSLRLWCCVLRVGDVFSIQVPRYCELQVLREKIITKQLYQHIHGFSVWQMVLFLAQKANGDWLLDDTSLDGLIRDETSENYERIFITEYWSGFDLKDFCDERACRPHAIQLLIRMPQPVALKMRQMMPISAFTTVYADFKRERFAEDLSTTMKKKATCRRGRSYCDGQTVVPSKEHKKTV